MNTLECLSRNAPKTIAIIGGGGKTTLLHRLGDYLAGQGKRVVLTTTTHFGTDEGAFSPISPEEVNNRLVPGEPLLCAYPDGHRMTGLPVEWYNQISAHHIVVEADGSRCHPLKVHRPHEPVVPAGTGLLLQVAGLSALDRRVEDCVHGWRELGLAPDALVDEALIARLLLRGFVHTNFDGPKLAVLNQADTPQLRARGTAIGSALETQGIKTLVTALKEGAVCSF